MMAPGSVEAAARWNITVVAEEGMFVAQLYEIDIVSQGSSPEQALRRLAATIEAERDYTTKNNGSVFAGIECGPPSSQAQTIAALQAFVARIGRAEKVTDLTGADLRQANYLLGKAFDGAALSQQEKG